MIFTNTPASRALAHCVLPMAPVCRGGDSSSETVNKTEVRDMRVVGGDGSVNLSMNAGDGGSNSTNVMVTDHGAVQGGLTVATKGIDAVVQQGTQLQQTTKDLYAGSLSFVKDANARAQNAVTAAGDQVVSMASKVAGDLATAFTDSKAPDKSLLMVGGVIVVGLAAVMVFAKKG